MKQRWFTVAGSIGAALILTNVALIVMFLTTGCGLTGGDVWNAATNVVSGGGGGSVTTTTTTTTTTTQPEAVSAYKITKVDANNIYWTGPCPNWKDVNGAIGEVHLYHVAGANGRHEGKFDHFRKYSGSYQRDFKNIRGGYRIARGWTVPASGEKMRLEMVSYDGKERIVVGEFGWVNPRWWTRWFGIGGDK